MPGNVIISTAAVPEGTCPPWIITLWPTLIGLVSGNLSGSLNVFNYGNSVPAPADQGKPWFRLNSDGTPDKWYAYSGGSWIALHPMAVGLISLWEGDITTIATFDGGEAAAVTATTGPMWEQVTELAARFPLGAGTLPSGSVVAVGGTGGEENHILVTAEMPVHQHANNPDNNGVFVRKSGGTLNASSGSGADYVSNPVANAGGDMGHNTMPPYYGLHFIRRTARRYYRV